MTLLLFKMGALAVKAGFRHGLCHLFGLGGVIVHIQLAGDHAVVHLAALVGALAVVHFKVHIGGNSVQAGAGVCFHLLSQRARQLGSALNGAQTLAIGRVRQHDGFRLCGKGGNIRHLKVAAVLRADKLGRL